MRRVGRTSGVQLGFAGLVAVLSSIAYGAATLPEAVEQAARGITGDEARAHLRFLASDELQGRGTGHQGNQVAELYLGTVFERLELGRPTGSAYLQPVELYFSRLGERNELVISEQVQRADVATRYAAGGDFQPHPSTAARSVSAGIVFAGYGISAPEFKYDDYAGVDATGRIVVALDGEPQQDEADSRFLGRASTPHARAEAKIENARKHGAVGLLLVRARLRDLSSAWPDNPSPRSRDFQLASQVDAETLAVGSISNTAADALLAGSPGGRKVADLKKAIETALSSAKEGPVSAPASFAVEGRQARISIDLSRERVVMHNVLGMVEGSDAERKNEIVVVSAHMDHDGLDADGRVFNGADDNGSGTVAVLEAAEAFAEAAQAGRRPSRTVVFALWNGEEKGLLGSEYYVAHPAPRGTLVANVNLDMVGRDEDVPDPSDFRFRGLDKTSASENTNMVHLLGYTYSPELAALVRQENGAIGLTIKETLDVNAQNLIRRSDQWSFLERRIPAVFFTTGLHPDYHTPQDDVGRINFGKLEKITRLAFRVAWRLATEPDLPEFQDPKPGVRASQID